MHLPGLARDVAQSLLDEAHTLCPYSRATHGNIDVTATLAHPCRRAARTRSQRGNANPGGRVGDLKKVLPNVSVRGALGEIQLAMLLEQFLSPEQLITNAVVQDGSAERVEFAVKLPGRDSDREVLLPIDAKFPQEDYERLVSASHLGDAEAVSEAGRVLENRVKLFAKTIREKYIHPPRTTDFAILFLPTEGLYAEVLRRPGLFEFLQREYHVCLTGPTTLTAFLNALQMGF